MEWYVPSGIAVAELQRTLNVINQFLETPFELDGKKAIELLSKKRRRRRRSPSPDSDSDNDAVLSGDQPRMKKRSEKKKKEKEIYKSAQFIQDSDEEYGDMDAFLEKEKIQREKANTAVTTAGASRLPTMKATGTKKRRTKNGEKGSKSKKQKSTTAPARLGDQTSDVDVERMHDSDGDVEIVEDSHIPANGIILDQPSKQPRPRPRPRPRPKGSVPAKPPPSSPTPSSGPETRSSSPLSRHVSPEPEGTLSSSQPHRRRRLILSEDED